jgi:hypothetical protein
MGRKSLRQEHSIGIRNKTSIKIIIILVLLFNYFLYKNMPRIKSKEQTKAASSSHSIIGSEVGHYYYYYY